MSFFKSPLLSGSDNYLVVDLSSPLPLHPSSQLSHSFSSQCTFLFISFLIFVWFGVCGHQTWSSCRLPDLEVFCYTLNTFLSPFHCPLGFDQVYFWNPFQFISLTVFSSGTTSGFSFTASASLPNSFCLRILICFNLVVELNFFEIFIFNQVSFIGSFVCLWFLLFSVV